MNLSYKIGFYGVAGFKVLLVDCLKEQRGVFETDFDEADLLKEIYGADGLV